MSNKQCKITGKNFTVSEFEKNFLKRIAPTFNGKKFEIPEPDICPEERMRQRTIQRNEENLHKMKSDYSGESLLSIYSDNSYKIYSHEEWWNGDWDAMSFGREFDFGRRFLEQFEELNREVPRVALIQVGNENCPYTTGTGYCRNCHLINCSENCEDCMYGKLLQGCSDVLDSDYAYDSELCYQCFNVSDCYNCVYLSYAQNSSDCYFSENLKGCRNCFLCTNLANKEYYFMNKPVDKAFFEKLVKDCMGSHEQMMKAKGILDEMRAKRVHKYANVINCEASTGDFLQNCKNCVECFDVNDSEDCMYVQVGVNVKDLLDCSNMYLKPELNYQVIGTIGTYNVHFSVFVFNSQDIWYSQFCYDCANLFGCVGLKNKQYCIFNKQYTKEEYEAELARIIGRMMETGEWGQFFPAEGSPFPYNDTLAYRYMRMSEEEALERGYKWRDADPRDYMRMSVAIADRIEDVGDEICKEVLACAVSGKNYKILEKELNFLRKMKLAVPRLCPEEREKLRLSMRQPLKLYDRVCAKTGEALRSPYAPDSSDVIYGEKAYLDEVF